MTADTEHDAHALRPHVDTFHDDRTGRTRWWPCVDDGPDRIAQFHSGSLFGNVWVGSYWAGGPLAMRPHLYRSRRHAREAAREARWTAREEGWGR